MWNCWPGAHAHWQFYSHRRWQVAPTTTTTERTTTVTTATPTPTHRHRSGCCQTPTVVSEPSPRLLLRPSPSLLPFSIALFWPLGLLRGQLSTNNNNNNTLRLLEAFQQYVLFSTRLAAITCNNLKAIPEEGRGRRNNTKRFENGPVYLNCKVRVHLELQSCQFYAYLL